MRLLTALCTLGALASSTLAQEDKNATVTDVKVGASVPDVATANIQVKAGYAVADCTEMCTVIVTSSIITTVLSTVTETVSGGGATVTETCTVTETDVVPTTDFKLTTKVVVSTAFETITTSYPVITTTVIECDDGDEPSGYPTAAPTYGADGAEIECDVCPPPAVPTCGTLTTTEWVTEIETQVTTVPTIVPTTIPITKATTVVQPTTIVKPTTSVTTKTITTEVPTTITSGTTIITTSVTTVYETTISVTTDSVTEIITSPPDTVTLPGDTDTITAPGDTVTAPGETITMPGKVTTLPASTVTTTVVEDGTTVTTTTTVPPSTITEPGSTITITPIYDVTVCPMPTGRMAPLDVKSNLTFGCAPGKVCAPPMPPGCNLWPDVPDADFNCEPHQCIDAPPFVRTQWKDNETSYFKPNYGYWNFNPEAFGLSYDIFEYETYEEVEDGKTITVTTGNWESQASLTAYPMPTSTAGYETSKKLVRRQLSKLTKRATDTPGICFDDCEYPLNVVLNVGKIDAICDPLGTFMLAYNQCAKCIKDNAEGTKDTIREYVGPKFDQFFENCSGKDTKPTTTSASRPDQDVTSTPDVTTTAQGSTGGGTLEPLPTSTTVETTKESTVVPTSEPTSEPSTTVTVPGATSLPSSADVSTEPSAAPSSTEETPSTEETVPSSTLESGVVSSGSTTVPEVPTTSSSTTVTFDNGSSTVVGVKPTPGPGQSSAPGVPGESSVPGAPVQTPPSTPTVPVIPSGPTTPIPVPTAAAVRSALPFTLGSILFTILAAFF